MRRLWRNLWITPACAALLGASACGDHGEKVLATITHDAGVPVVVAKCVPRIVEPPDVGLDLYFVIDHSGFLDLGDWSLLWTGLKGVFEPGPAEMRPSTEFEGMGIGFAIFPPIPQSCIEACGVPRTCSCLIDCGCERPMVDFQGNCQCPEWQTSCLEEDNKPVLEITRSAGAQFSQRLATLSAPPNGLPAFRPALGGSRRYRDDWDSKFPGRRVTQVLIGASSFEDWACSSRISDVEKQLREGDAATNSDKSKTYVVAVNPSMSDLDDYDRLAAAGKTSKAIEIQINMRSPAPVSDFVELIRKIRETDGRCEYLVPNGEDMEKVNLRGKSGDALFQRVQSSDGCKDNPLGWYFDRSRPGEAARMIACEGTCKALRSPGGPKLELGCPTVIDDGGT